MKPHQYRVIQERNALDELINKLSAFKETEVFQHLDKVEQNLLQEQWMAMTDYLDILNLRIERF